MQPSAGKYVSAYREIGMAASTVDIREIDGRPVVDTRPGDDRVLRLMRRASELGATEVGGPVDLNGPRNGFFSDDVHHDHIHLGITPGDPLAHLR
ncbi:hypothetical protein EDD19_12828 [Dietzia cinnamea]|uniref:Uncharacterized protein n=2 Tax=Dietziaceae TaxID=85029 RepID=A0A4R3ZPH4_9ACTN|nr:hypothetical protein EDD19_12828 [Dietzia cinnamea]